MRIHWVGLVVLSGCANSVSGSVDGHEPFKAQSALWYTAGAPAIDLSDAPAAEACNAARLHEGAGTGGMLISGLPGGAGTFDVISDADARAGKRGVVVFYNETSGSHQTHWTGSVTVSDIAEQTVTGHFELEVGIDHIRGNFRAGPCLLSGHNN